MQNIAVRSAIGTFTMDEHTASTDKKINTETKESDLYLVLNY